MTHFQRIVAAIVIAAAALAPGAEAMAQSLWLPTIQAPGRTAPTPPTPPVASGTEWPTVAANAERNSWTPVEVSGNLHVEWYRPIEAYIPQNVQVIAAQGNLYISTAGGLVVLDAASGELAWRWDTELPLGNSPTVADGVVYVAGYDRKLHALDAATGRHLWEFAGAKAGYDTNPLVVDGRVFVGNRDGVMYAVGAHGTPQQGRLLWDFDTQQPIHLTAAHHGGVIYFASNDNRAYALVAETGEMLWRSEPLPTNGFQAYWPVAHGDKVIYSGAPNYRPGAPGVGAAPDSHAEIFAGVAGGQLIGEMLPSEAWSGRSPVLDAQRILDYYEANPARRVVFVLNQDGGREFTFDSDGDGAAEYAPVAYYGTQTGFNYPPAVGQDGLLYFNNYYQNTPIPQGRVMGWLQGSPYFAVTGAQGAVDEPQALAAGGGRIYRSICCDRVGDSYALGAGRPDTLWTYINNLVEQAPGYDVMWHIEEGLPRLQGWYEGAIESANAAYHNHGVQNPLIPYGGRVYSHHSNAVIAFGSAPAIGALPPVERRAADDATLRTLTDADLAARLEEEIGKMIEAGPLRPGYYGVSQFQYWNMADYFDNPGDTLRVLSLAYPHLSAATQAELRAYLEQHWETYFDPEMIARMGWSRGALRNAGPLPPEVVADMANYPDRARAAGFSWSYPQHNFYAMWKYAALFPDKAGRAYELAKARLEVPVTQPAEYFRQTPFELNTYIAGYTGFLELQELAGQATTDATLRATVQSELARLQEMRVDIFTKEPFFGPDRYHRKKLDLVRNFLYMTPELGEYLHAQIPVQVQEAWDEYTYIAPYWFVSRYEATTGEGVMSPLYNYWGLFQAQAYALDAPQAELTNWVDAPAFAVGDLFYLDNLVAALNAE